MTIELVRQLPYDHPYRWDGTIFGGARLWRPPELGTALALWLDAEDASTITLNGSTVSQWADKSGLGNNATQPVAARQPTFVPSGLNGKSVLRYNGSNWLDTAAEVSTRSAVVTAKWSSAAGDYRAILGHTPDFYPFHGDTEASGSLISVQYSSVAVRDGEKFVNGTLTAGNLARYLSPTVHVFNTTGAVTLDRFSADRGFEDRGFLGDMQEIVLLSAVPSTADRQKLEGYLAWKWLLEGSLPADHPYKNSPPTV